MEYLETEECSLFSGGDVVRCADGTQESKQDAEEMEKLIQGGRGTALGGDCGRTEQKSSTTSMHRLDSAGFAGCSRSLELGSRKSGRFIKF